MSCKENHSLPSRQFRTTNRNAESAFLDVGRAEVLLNMIVAPDLANGDQLFEFIGSVYGASNGDPAVLRLAIEAFSNWPQLDSDASAREIERLWRAFEERGTATLRQICAEQSLPLPASMMEALFDDPSFDFVAYLNWHNEGAA